MKKHILYAIPLFASCLVACSDWDDHFSNADNGGAHLYKVDVSL